MEFNPTSATTMHVDINSCFATIEQQANPCLRGKPIVVGAYTTNSGCVLAASIEAKKLGIKTGMSVGEAKRIYPSIYVTEPDAPKYRFVHLAMRKILEQYTPYYAPKSIDEFVLNLKHSPYLRNKTPKDMALEIKKRIRTEIGEWMSVSVGIGPNRLLAKVASNMQKPDGLTEININNFWYAYGKLTLTDLHGINIRNQLRLNSVGINTVKEFYESPLPRLRAAFHSINAYYWYMRLRGWEVDDIEFGRKSFGNSYAIPQKLSSPEELSPILAKLVNKTASRLRASNFGANGVHVSLSYKNHYYWHKGEKSKRLLFETRDIYRTAHKILLKAHHRAPVHVIAVTCYDLVSLSTKQLDFFEDIVKKENISQAIDKVNNDFGAFVVSTANTAKAPDAVKDRIAFGGVAEL